MENLVLNQYCLKVKCHLTFCRTSYAHAKEDPFVVKVVFVLNRICPAQNFVIAKLHVSLTIVMRNPIIIRLGV
jgi:hypothetical protein